MQLMELEQRLDLKLIDWRLDGRAAANGAAAARAWSRAVWEAAIALGPAELGAEDVSRGLALTHRPVFICGVHRSGTTLVRDLLDSHPNLNVLPAEGLFFTHLSRRIVGLDSERALAEVGCQWLERLADPSSQPPFWLLGRSSPDHSPYVAFARALAAWWRVCERAIGGRVKPWPLVSTMLAYAQVQGGGRIPQQFMRWAEKTPTNERHIERLLADFPDAKIIHVIRDPRSVFESRKSMEVQTFGRFGNRREVLKDLARSYRVALARQRSDDAAYLLMRYEDLTERPDGQIERMAAFLEIEPLPILWRPTIGALPASNNTSFGPRAPADEALAARSFTPPHRLDRADEDLIGSCLGALASRLGYGIAPVGGWKARLRALRY